VKISIKRVCGVVLVCAAAVVVSGCGRTSTDSSVASAKEQIDKKQYKSAIVTLKAAIQANGQNAEARYLLGTALLEDGEAVAAAVELAKAVELGHDAEIAVPALARAMVRAGQSRRLIEQHGATPLSKPRSIADLQTSLTLAYNEERNREGAARALDQALKADPKFTPARLLKARAQGAEGKFDDALATLAQVLTEEPNLTRALQLRGEMLLMGKQDTKAATEAFEAALRQDAKYAAAHSALTSLALLNGDYELASRRLDQMQKALPDDRQTLLYQAQVALAQDKLQLAREKTLVLLRLAPDSPVLLHLSGAIEFQAGALVLAESQLSKALSLAPREPGIRTLLAQTYLRGGEPAKAIAMLAPLLDVPQPNAQILGLAASAQLQAGKTDEANRLYVRAAKADPSDARFRTALAVARVSRGESAAGLAELESLAEKDATSFSNYALVSARIATGDLPGAIKALDPIEKKEPKSAQAPYTRGVLQLRSKDAAGARASFERALSVDARFFPAMKALAELDLREGKAAAAATRFETAVAAEPANYRARLALVELKVRGGAKPEEALALIDEAVKLSPSATEPRLALINHHLSTRQAKLALTAAQAAVATLPNDLEITDALGRAHLAAGEHQQALAAFRKVSTAMPSSPLPLVRLAEVHSRLGDSAAAVQVLRQALGLDPKLLIAQRSLIDLHIQAKQWAEAAKVAKAVQQQIPDRPEGWLWEGAVQAAQKKWEPAITAYQAAARKQQSSHLTMQWHAALDAAGRRKEADKLAADWLAAHKTDVAFKMYVGDLANARGDYPAAERLYRAVVEQQKDNGIAINNLAWVLVKQNKPDALELAERAVGLDPKNPAFLDTKALALAARNDLKQAIEVQKQAVALAPELPILRLHLARLAIKSGEKELAKGELDRLAYLGEKFSGQAEVIKMLGSLR